MRLLERNSAGEFVLTKDFYDEIPQYAILSHTWKDGEEVTFKDLMDGTGKGKTGYDKIHFCAQQAKRDGLQYFWVDTCCIDKSNSVELQEAINSMFRWYQNAVKCYVYLSDVSSPVFDTNDKPSQLPCESAFRNSKSAASMGHVRRSNNLSADVGPGSPALHGRGIERSEPWSSRALDV